MEASAKTLTRKGQIQDTVGTLKDVKIDHTTHVGGRRAGSPPTGRKPVLGSLMWFWLQGGTLGSPPRPRVWKQARPAWARTQPQPLPERDPPGLQASPAPAVLVPLPRLCALQVTAPSEPSFLHLPPFLVSFEDSLKYCL